jgi:hypothetical protein
MDKPLRILCVPDTQCKPGVPLDHLDWLGKAIVYYQPDVVVHLGDHWDMPSLSSHDKPGSKYFENRRYKEDIEAGNEGMRRIRAPLLELQKKQKKNKEKVFKPRMVYLRGNHCARVVRAVQNNPILEGTLSYDDMDTSGWEVYDFLHPCFINGVCMSHYLPVGAMGRPASSPAAIIGKLHQSAVVGHQQSRQVAYGKRADGKHICAIIAGSYYLHDEHYLDMLSNRVWRGLVMLNEVQDGQFDEMFLSIKYLERKFGEGTNLTANL